MQSTDYWKKKYEEAIFAFPPAPNHHEAQYPIACNGIRAEIPESQIWQDIYDCQSRYGKTQPVNTVEIDNTIAKARDHAWDGWTRTSTDYAPTQAHASYAPSKPAKALLAEATTTRGDALIDEMKKSTKDIPDPFAFLSARPDHAQNIQKLEALKRLFRPSDYVYIGAIDGTPKKWFGQLGGKPIKTMQDWAKWEHIDAYLSDPDVAFYAINPLKDALSKKASNVADYRHILLEIDTQTLDDQAMIILYLMRAGLPIVSVVKSGNKSLHALIKIDGVSTAEDYKKMAVAIIKNRLSILGADSACINPDRMSRLPGAVTIDDKGRTRHQDVVYLCDDETRIGITMDDAIKVLDDAGISPVVTAAAENSESVETGLPWIVTDEKGKMTYSNTRLVTWLAEQGFCQEDCSTTSTARYIRVQGNVYDVYILGKIQTFILKFAKENGTEAEHELTVKNRKSVDELTLHDLPTREIKTIKDTSSKVHIPFANGMLAVNATDATLIPYADIDGMIARSAILAREYLPGVSPKGCDFERFLEMIMGGDSSRKDAICSAIGYLVSRYKKPSCGKAIILTDASPDDNHGGTGKGMIYNAISLVRNGYVIDGKEMENENKARFAFSGVTPETQVIHIDDLSKRYNIEKLFPKITGEMNAEEKNEKNKKIQFADSPKMILTTNYWLKGVDDSFRRRVNIYELDNHFNAEHTPEDEFGHMFFGDDWTIEEWQKFDAVMIACVQTYIQHGLIAAKPSDASQIKTLRAECGEAFIDWLTDNMPHTDGTFYPNSYFDNYFAKEPSQADKTKIKKLLKTWAELSGLIYTSEQEGKSRTRGFSLRQKGAVIETKSEADKEKMMDEIMKEEIPTGKPIPFSAAEKAFLGDDSKAEDAK